MELLQCPRCGRRYIVASFEQDARWRCSQCPDELDLVVRSLPGSAEQVARELSAQPLDPPDAGRDRRGAER